MSNEDNKIDRESGEENEPVVEPSFEGGVVHCPSPVLVDSAGRSLKITCQKLFRLAYGLGGYAESFSRAMFVEFARSGFRDDRIPQVVRKLCMNKHNLPSFNDEFGVRGVNKCMGCSMSKNGFNWLMTTYGIVHPEVNSEMLKHHAENISTCRAPNPVIEEITPEEKAWRELVSFGVFDGDDLDWRDAASG